MRAPRIWCWKSCAPAATLRGQPSTVAALEQPPGAGAAATPGSRAARGNGGELPGAGFRGGSGGSDTEDVRGNEAQRRSRRYCSATDESVDGLRKMAGLKWRRPRQPHPGTRCSRCGCFLPDLTRLTGNRCGDRQGHHCSLPSGRPRHSTGLRVSYNHFKHLRLQSISRKRFIAAGSDPPAAAGSIRSARYRHTGPGCPSPAWC